MRATGATLIGIGVDTVEIERIALVASRHPRFAGRVLSEAERARFECFRSEARRASFLAGRFAAKEAVMKSLGVGMGRLRWRDISVISGPTGKPEVRLSGTALKVAREQGVTRMHVSISHGREIALASAIAAAVDSEDDGEGRGGSGGKGRP